MRVVFPLWLVLLIPIHDVDAAHPLKQLPSKPGPHITKIKALRSGQWLTLGKPRPDAKYGHAPGRSYTNKMAYAQTLGGAFLYGEGVHGKAMMRGGGLHYNDDLFFYDVNAHAWICVHPGTDVHNEQRTLDKHGFEITADGQHIPIAAAVHGYECTVYIDAIQSFMTLQTGSPYWRNQLQKRRSQWLKGKTSDRTIGKHPFLYNVMTGKWRRPFVTGGGPRPRFCASLIHLPTKRRVAYYERKNDLWFYDYNKHRWHHVQPKGTGPDTPDYEGVSCYDSKRHRIVVLNRNRRAAGAFAIYDVATNTWRQSKAKRQPDQMVNRGYGSASAGAHYDRTNDEVLVWVINDGRPALFVYHPAKDEWDAQPVTRLPMNASQRHGSFNSFYDAEHNVHVFFEARDSRVTPGVVHVYRYGTN